MKRFFILGITCLLTLLLVSCAGSRSRYYDNQIQGDLAQENWIHHFNLNPNLWTQCADRWFFTDEPRNFDEYESNAPLSRSITAMMVRVPDFTNIVVTGPYRIQIYGSQIHNSVYVLGPNESARHTSVDIRGNTIYIHPDPQCTSTCLNNTNEVIVRIGVRDLNYLKANGSGLIEGKNIYSSNLTLLSTRMNEILLTGNMQLTRLMQGGGRTISVIGAYSPITDVNVMNRGNVNISGHVGIRNIVKTNVGELNILGADTDGLNIRSSGSGITRIVGYSNLRRIDVSENSRVYLYWVASNGIYINVRQNGRIGLAGAAKNIDVEASGNARFGGKYLRADNIYVRTRDFSHANVNPVCKIFANALEHSSIYFFGSPNVVSRYTSGNGMVVPIFSDACPIPMAPAPAAGCAVFKDETSYFPPRAVRRYYKAERNYKDERPFDHSSVRRYSSSVRHHQPSYRPSSSSRGDIPYRNAVPD